MRTCLISILLLGLVPCLALAQQPANAYDKIDTVRLAESLRLYRMDELLDSLEAWADKTDTPPALAVRAECRIAEALAAKDEATRKSKYDSAVKVLESLVEKTKNAPSDRELVDHYRYTLKLAVLQGVTMVDAPAERLQYFLGRLSDAATVEKLTKPALALVESLANRVKMKMDDWAGNEERMAAGLTLELEQLLAEAKYRGAWIRLYRGLVLPEKLDNKLNAERIDLLKIAISDVAEFANAEDDSSGVKYLSLLLSGMAARELGEWNNAMQFYKQAGVPQAGTSIQIKALFETAHCLIDQAQYDQAGKFIDTDFMAAKRWLAKDQQIMVDVQSTLLKSQLLEVQARRLAESDKARSQQLMDRAIKVLLDFAEKNPSYRPAFLEVLAPKYEGRDVKDVSPEIQFFLAVMHYNKGPEGLAEARKVFELLKANKNASKDMQAGCLWYLAWTNQQEKKNRESARLFRELAEKFPSDSRARDAANNAIFMMQGIMKQRNARAEDLGTDFVKEYAETLRVMVDGWGKTDADVRNNFGYELGLQYNTLAQRDKAMEAFSKIDARSDLYLPARFWILTQRVEMLMDSTDKTTRKTMGDSLLADLKDYQARAREFVKTTTQPARGKEVQTMGARCQLLQAQLLKDVLNDPAKAITAAEDLPRDWPGVAEAKQYSNEFVVRVLLEQGETAKAMDKLKSSPGSDALMSQAIGQISVRIDRLEGQADEESKKQLEEYCKAYYDFAQRLNESIKGLNLSAEQSFPFRQAYVRSLEFSKSNEDMAKALQEYLQLELEKPNNFITIRGIARCYRKLGQAEKAAKQYDLLLDALAEDSADWWRISVERLQFFLETAGNNKPALNDILLEIRRLRDMKEGKVELWRQFNSIELEAKKQLAALGGAAEGESRPAGK